MRCHNNMLCLALTNSLFDESTTLSMLLIKPFTIYLHNNMLECGHEYEIKISKGTIEGWKWYTAM